MAIIKAQKVISKYFNSISHNNLFAFFICCGLIIIALSMFNLAVYSYFKTPRFFGVKIQLNTQDDLISKRAFWDNFLTNYPSYLSGWVELAKVELQLENVDSAIAALDIASNIDPNSGLVINAKKEFGLALP